MASWFGAPPKVSQEPRPPSPQFDAPTHPNEPAWELVEAIEARAKEPRNARPFVTLSWAQGLDGSMALAGGKDDERLMLSGTKSMALTHGLRRVHEAILVGRGTVEGDDSRLTVRTDVDGKDLEVDAQPAAVILDGSLSTPPDSKIIAQAKTRRVIIVTGGDPDAQVCDFAERPPKTWSMAKIQRGAALVCRGASIVCVPPSQGTERPALEEVLRTLKHLNLGSVFVEGGVDVIDAFLRKPALVDHVVVTVAPLFAGGRRPPAGPLAAPLRLRRVETLALGDDVVIAGRPPAAVDFGNVGPEFAQDEENARATASEEEDDELTEYDRMSRRHVAADAARNEKRIRAELAQEHGLAPSDTIITQAVEDARAET